MSSRSLAPMLIRVALTFLVLVCLLPPSPLRAAVIWVEGEKPVRSTMHRHPWWYDQVKREQFSGGDFMSNFHKNPGEGTRRITSIGHDPWLVREIRGTVKFRRADASSLKVTALDANGYPVKQAGTADDIRLLPNVLYYVIAP